MLPFFHPEISLYILEISANKIFSNDLQVIHFFCIPLFVDSSLAAISKKPSFANQPLNNFTHDHFYSLVCYLVLMLFVY